MDGNPTGSLAGGNDAARTFVTDAAEWDARLRDAPHAFAHTHGHCVAMALASGRPTFLLTLETDDGAVHCPLQERCKDGHLDVVTPYGFGGPVGALHSGDLVPRWNGFVAERGYVCAYIGLNPVFDGRRLFPSGDVFSQNTVFILDLGTPSEVLLGRLSANRRRQIRAAGSPIEEVAPLRAFFLRNFHDFMASRGAAAVYSFSPAALERLLDARGVMLLGAGDGAIEAVVVIGHTPWTADYLFGVSTEPGSRYMAGLLWAAAMRMQAAGVRSFNLGGGVRPADGVAEFKRRFGGEERSLYAVRQIYRPDTYRALCLAAGTPATDRTAFFPGYHRS